jgi:hypothetical protein
VRKHVVAKLFEQLRDCLQFRMGLALLDRQLASHLCQPWQFLAHALVMYANDVLNEPSEWKLCWIEGQGACFVRLSISEFLQDLIYGELLFRARFAERLVSLGAEVNVEPVKDPGCRGMCCNDFADGLCR